MFYLSFGLVAGVLLAYLATRILRRLPLTGSWRAWLAVEIELMLLVPIILEFFKTEYDDGRDLLVAIWLVFFRWLAGVGLGVWIFLTALQLQRFLRKLWRGLMRRGRHGESRAARQQLSREVHSKIANSWRHMRDIEFADRRNLIRESKGRSDYLGKIVYAGGRKKTEQQARGR